MKKKVSVKTWVLCAFFAALTAVCSQIEIPLAVIPINLALFSVNLCSALMKKKYAATSMVVYVLMGLVGLPVFAGFEGGLGVLFGRTGGYIIGYVFCAFVTSLLLERWGRDWRRMSLSMALGDLTCYTFGTAWYMVLTGNPLWLSLMYCVLPFLPGDAIKITLAVALAGRLEKPLKTVMH